MALEEFLLFLRGVLDSDPEVVASLSLCGHARRQQRQWHAFSSFCWSWCTSRCVSECCRQEVATLVVNNGSGTIPLVLVVFMHLALCS